MALFFKFQRRVEPQNSTTTNYAGKKTVKMTKRKKRLVLAEIGGFWDKFWRSETDHIGEF